MHGARRFEHSKRVLGYGGELCVGDGSGLEIARRLQPRNVFSRGTVRHRLAAGVAVVLLTAEVDSLLGRERGGLVREVQRNESRVAVAAHGQRIRRARAPASRVVGAVRHHERGRGGGRRQPRKTEAVGSRAQPCHADGLPAGGERRRRSIARRRGGLRRQREAAVPKLPARDADRRVREEARGVAQRRRFAGAEAANGDFQIRSGRSPLFGLAVPALERGHERNALVAAESFERELQSSWRLC